MLGPLKNEKGVGNRIQLNDVTKFASGTFGRGKRQQFVLWAFGKTGWFEIHPSQSYQAVYDEMIEGVKLFYFLCDQYTAKGKQRRPSAKQIYKAYATASDSRCSTVEEAQQLLYKHHYFLISEMINDTQEIGWIKAPIFKDLSDTFPEATQNTRLRILDSSDEESKKTDDGISSADSEANTEKPEPTSQEHDNETGPQTPKGGTRQNRRRPRQSVLRPTSSRPIKSAKSRGKAPKAADFESPTESQADTEDEEEDAEDTENHEVLTEEPERTDHEMEEDLNASRNEVSVATTLSHENETASPKTNGTSSSETKGLHTTERVKIVQSEGQRGARVGNLLDFVMNRVGG
ncbi:MAG: hypothetical protein Q9160_008061 [Pyrenula sp. 1 TL-2023]